MAARTFCIAMFFHKVSMSLRNHCLYTFNSLFVTLHSGRVSFNSKIFADPLSGFPRFTRVQMSNLTLNGISTPRGIGCEPRYNGVHHNCRRELKFLKTLLQFPRIVFFDRTSFPVHFRDNFFKKDFIQILTRRNFCHS